MHSNKSIGQIYVLISLFLLYCFSVLLQLEIVANALSPAILISAAAIIYSSLRPNYSKHKSSEVWFLKYRPAWILLAISLLWWSGVDILWAVFVHVFGKNPDSMDLFLYLYTVPNLLMAAAAVAFIFSQRQRWNFVILIMDALVTAIISSGVLWILFFRSLLPTGYFLNALTVTTSIYIISDAVVLTCFFIWFLSVRFRQTPVPGIIIIVSVLVYTITDLFYGYVLFGNLYVPNTLIDVMYMVYAVLIAAGIYQAARQNRKPYPPAAAEENLRSNRKILLLLIIPFVLALMNDFELEILLVFNSVILIHQFASAILLSRSRTEAIRQAEARYRSELEKTVAEKTEELISSNNELSRLAREDNVTSLDNRRYFISALDHTISNIRTGKENGQIVLFYMDIDNFRAINDTYGHEAGDLMLRAVADRLKLHLPADSQLARLGGDEFVMSFKVNDDYSGIELLARKIVSSFNQPVYQEEYVFHTSLSIGITLYPQDGKNRTELLKNAVLSMYHAKAKGTGNYCFFHDIPKSMVFRKNEIAIKLKSADYDKEFELHYQPHIRISDGELIGTEALLRWHQPDLGSVSPAEFIPIAETNGEIIKIGNWVMKRAMTQIKEWHDKYDHKFRVSINISPIQLDQDSFLDILMRTLGETGAKPEMIDLEITENSAVNREERLVKVFEKIYATGCSISIDDFGTGYSCLSYLKKFSVNRLKIAKQLIDGISSDEDDTEIVTAIIAMAKALKLRTIAEGVEEAAQLRKLSELGCDEIQGFYFSRALSVEKFEKRYLKEWSKASKPASGKHIYD